MPNRDMQERQPRSGRSDGFQVPRINQEIVPGVMEAGQAGGGGWRAKYNLAMTPGFPGKNALLRAAKEQAHLALVASEDETEMTVIAEAIRKMDEEIVPGVMEAGRAGTSGDAQGNEVQSGQTETGDKDYYKDFSRQDWIDLVRKECREREAFTDPRHLQGWENMGINTSSGWEVPLFPQLLKRTSEFGPLYDRLRAEVEARRGVHAAFVVYDAKRLDLTGLVSSLAGRALSEGQTGPAREERVEYFSMKWLESLANSEGDLGSRIGRGLQIYIQAGMKARQENMLNIQLADTTISAVTRKRLQSELEQIKRERVPGRLDGVDLFSDPLTEAAVALHRERIRNDVGADAEDLAYKLTYLFGLAGKFGYSQSLGCSNRDALAQLFRPNDAWQIKRKYATVDPLPETIAGKKDNFASQRLRYYSFMVTFPELVGEVMLKSGRTLPLMEVLASGDFAQVRWRELTSDYGGYVDRMVKGYTLNGELMDPGENLTKTTQQAFGNLQDLAGRALSHMRHIIDPNKRKQFTTSDGVSWNKLDPEFRTGVDDTMVQEVLFLQALKILRAHDPSSNPDEKLWWGAAEAVTFLQKSVRPYMEPARFRELDRAIGGWQRDLRTSMARAQKHVGI